MVIISENIKSKGEKMFRKITQISLIAFLLIVFTQPAPAQHQLDLTGNVPIYGQQQCVWCGAASAQMIMDGYPNPANRVFDTQQNIWNTIQANNSNDPTDVATNWATDPIGLREALMLLNPPPGGTWSIHADANRDTVMFDILYWMNRNNYPVATLINRGGHWVVIVGFESDIAPVSGSNPTLQQITINDPEPHNVGSQSTMTAAVWYATDWNGSVQYAGTWSNQYVAVIEPPVQKGSVKVNRIKRIGDKVIPAEDAVRSARAWVSKSELSKKAPYSILRRKTVINLQPMLVREQSKPILAHEQIKPDLTEKVPNYYIVPFGFQSEIGKCGIGLTRVCVIINAYTGQFEEVGAFGKPVKYLSEKEALNVVTRSLKLKPIGMRKMVATLMFQPSDITHIRLYPFWKVSIADRVLYVDQLGELHTAIRPYVPGD
jgi:hypothetical protein